MRQTVTMATIGWILTATAAVHASEADKLFAQPNHDFGTVARGAQLLHKFTWTNSEKQRIEVTEIRSSCTCVTAVAVPKALEPGQTGAIEVTLDAKKFVGEKTFTIYVTVGPKSLRQATLTAKAHCRPDVVFNPGQVSFGTVAEAAAASQVLEVEYAGKLEWKITELVNGCPYLDAAFEEAYRKPGQVGYKIKVNLKANAPVGEFKQELQFKTNDPNVPSAGVLVEGIVKPALVAVPNPLDMGEGRKNKAVSRKLTVRGDKPFEIVKVETVGEGLTVSAPSGSAASHVIQVNWQSKEGDLTGELIIHTNQEKNAVIRVPVMGQGP